MNELKVYYWSVCPHCRATMEWLKQKGIPFEVKLNVPNETTAAAIREGRTIAYDKTATGYGNMADLRAALEV